MSIEVSVCVCVVQLDAEPFIQVYNSTGPFHGVPDAGGPQDKSQAMSQAV